MKCIICFKEFESNYKCQLTCSKKCSNILRNKRITKFKKEHYPWISHYKGTYSRCYNPKCLSYKSYGGRGIKLLMTMKDFKYLWFRDKAYLLKKPSIDRIDNDENYILDNCQFIELEENKRKRRQKRFF